MNRVLLLVLWLLVAPPAFHKGQTVYRKSNNSVGMVADVHPAHGYHDESHYLVIWVAGKDSGYSSWLYEYLIRK